MTLSLREKRRIETAREIQGAALRLALEHGLDQVTTDAIAKAAGISTRTFFNYFLNKEAAVIGTPPGYRPEDKAALQDGTNPLDHDLKRFLDQHINALAHSAETLRMVHQVVGNHPKARSLLTQFIVEECNELAACLANRVGDQNVAMALADMAMRCTGRAISLWVTAEKMTLAEAMDQAWADHIAASRLLVQAAV